MTELVINPPFSEMDIDIVRDADWLDAFQIIEEDGSAVNLTGLTLELYIRPSFANATLLKKLTSVASAGIIIDSATEGMASFSLARATIQSDLPIGEWKQFLLLKTGSAYEELWRGDFKVFPGNTS